MGILRDTIFDDRSRLGIWVLEEPVSWLKNKVTLSEEEERRFAELANEQRKREWLAARVLIQHLAGQEEQVIYDEFRKPHLASGNFHLSISHSGGKVAIILHPDYPTGIDIQERTEKVWRIRHKFLSSEELKACSDGEDHDKLLIYWAAKEAMYKYYGRKRLHFSLNLWVSPFEFSDIGGEFAGEIRLSGQTIGLNMAYEKSGDCFLVFVMNN